MNDSRRKTDSQKERTRKARVARTSKTRRERDWSISRQAADDAGFPLNAFLTTHWGKDSSKEKDRETWRRLRICINRLDAPWVAMRAPEHAPGKQHHMHSVFHAPDNAWPEVIAMIERITGKVAALIAFEGMTIGWHHGVVAKSQDGSWMLQRNIPAMGTNEHLINYIAKQSGKDKSIGRHQRSAALMDMTKLHLGAIQALSGGVTSI